MMYQWGYGNGYAAWAIASMIIFFIIVVVGIVLLLKVFSQKNVTKNGHDEAMDILKRRYVNGEIDKQEFEEKQSVLNGK